MRGPLPRGLRRLDLLWPEPPAAVGDPIALVADRLERGLPAQLHPVFGEVAALRVGRA